MWTTDSDAMRVAFLAHDEVVPHTAVEADGVAGWVFKRTGDGAVRGILVGL